MLILKPSLIHGVGVFTTEDIAKGKVLPLFAPGDWKYVGSVSGWKARYCVRTGERGGGYYAPEDYHRMSIGWYLNHSKLPNVSLSWRAKKAIRSGDELTINYEGLGEPTSNLK